MKIILLGYPNRAGIQKIAQDLMPEIKQIADVVCSDFTGEKQLSRYNADAVVVLGGDGSIFRAVNQMGEKQRPLIAVNLGRLGFLADVAREELVPLLKLFDGKPLPVVPLMMYQCRILRGGKAIKTVQGVNDFASIGEVVYRRFRALKEADERFPDILLIDGGKIQLRFALESLRKLNLKTMPTVISLAKRDEEVYVSEFEEPLRLSRHAWSLRLLQFVRDESHRFAQHYHHILRRKEIEGDE